MGESDEREACGRCSFSTVVDAVEEHGDDSRPRHDPFEGGHIEVDERDLRLVSSPAVLAGRLRRRLDDAAERLVRKR